MISSWTTFLRHFISQKHRPWNALLLKGKCRPSHFKEIRSCMYLYTTSMDWVRHWHWSGDSYEVKTKYQNEEERWFRWLWKWHGRWCQTGWFDKLLIYWDFHMQPSPGFIENGGRGGGVRWVAVLWAKMLCWLQRPETNSQSGLSLQKRGSNSNNHQYADEHRRTQHKEYGSRWPTAEDDHTGCRSCHLGTGNWVARVH